MAASPGRFLPGPTPPRSAAAGSKAPPPPPRSSRSSCCYGGTARAGSAPQGPPRSPLHQKIQIQQRQEAKEGGSGARAEPAAPRPHRFAASPSGTARPIVFQTPKFNGIIISMGPEGWGLCPGRGAVPGRPVPGERGLGPPGAPGPKAAAGRCGAVALRRAIRGCGFTGDVADLAGAKRPLEAVLIRPPRNVEGERLRAGIAAGPPRGAACGSGVRTSRGRAGLRGAAPRPRVTPPAVQRQGARCRRAGGGFRASPERVSHFVLPLGTPPSHPPPPRHGCAGAPFPISHRVS